ncbi:MAG: anti-sigma factor antagonist [Mojavia pulchra JT2-VF2]|jgi:anti-sigma B factor antagonist|uniref:Anti-sigma factor antagonist n=1 Tax=Mojavia pulchra JT2-VF2 TaxID=287848 RepID=A0A951PWX3_9NOST|nr:anti-sigma factor antagonist [Mojavia pulchra JT2-VF2]
MDIIIKTLQVTALSTAQSDTAPAVHEQVTVVELDGDVDGKTAPEVQAQVLPLVQPGSKILLDLTNVPYMSSAGLRTLLLLHRQFLGKEGQLVLVGVAEEIQDTMSITGFLNFFTICETLDSGLESLNLKVHALPA